MHLHYTQALFNSRFIFVTIGALYKRKDVFYNYILQIRNCLSHPQKNASMKHSLRHPGSETLKIIFFSVLALLVNIMLVACVIRYVGYCQSGKRHLLYDDIFQEYNKLFYS